jgi:hypothetical protein
MENQLISIVLRMIRECDREARPLKGITRLVVDWIEIGSSQLSYSATVEIVLAQCQVQMTVKKGQAKARTQRD